MINPKNICAFAGIYMLKRGMSTIICYVLIMDQSCCKLAERMIFKAKFPAIIAFVVYFSTAVAV